MLYLANRYCHDLRRALQVNAELGGDNVHRGSVLALILSLCCQHDLADWYAQLAIADELDDNLLALGLLS